jgi:type IV secretory pathway TrbD component
MRVLVEVFHILAGLFAAILIASLAAWAYPLARQDIWLVTYVAMAAVAVMGVAPIRRAFEADRADLKPSQSEGPDS